MGMHNAASTTVGLAVANFNVPSHCRIIVLRSSDDSMSVYIADSEGKLYLLIELDRKNLKLLGINLSPDKTFFFDRGYGEYTSWYVDGSFVSQYGVETAALKPQGKNPHDDFHSVAKSVQIAMLNNNINPIGGEAWLRVGVDNVRRLYKINKRGESNGRMTLDCHLLSDGGHNIWNIGNCHLEETSVRERLIRTEEDRKYFLRVNNPENPFCGPPSEEITFSKELNQLMVSTPEIPRNCFTFLRRSNRTGLNRKSNKKVELERASMEAVQIANAIDFNTYLSMPSTKAPLAHYLADKLEDHTLGLDLDDDTRDLLERALGRLREGEDEDLDTECPGLFGADLDADIDFDEIL